MTTYKTNGELVYKEFAEREYTEEYKKQHKDKVGYVFTAIRTRVIGMYYRCLRV